MTREALPHLDVGSGSPVVLLHGFGIDGRMWSAQIAALRGNHRVLVPDFPGFGPDGAQTGRWNPAGEVLDLLEAKALEPVHLVGLSFGGAVAVDLLLARPDRVRSLVLVDARLLGERRALLGWSTLVERARAGDLPGARDAWLANPVFERLALQPEAFRRVREMVQSYRGGHWVGTVEDSWYHDQPRALLASVRCPTLVAVGELDGEGFRAMARIYAETIPGARLVELEGVGHMGPMEVPERFNELLSDFIAEHETSSPRLPASPQLEFRTWRAGDLAMALDLWGDARVTALIAREAFDRVQVEARLQQEIELQDRLGLQYWPILLRSTGELVGCCGLRPRESGEAVVEVGFHLRPQFWGRGLATEAARAALEHAFEVLGVTAVFAGHHPENAASRRVLENLGFRHTHREVYPPTGLEHPVYLLKRNQFRRPSR